jgi:hypothetical protein
MLWFLYMRVLYRASNEARLIPGPRGQFAALLPCVDLLLMQQQKVEQLRSARGAQAILAVRRRDEQLAVAPSERDAIHIDTVHSFILSPRPDRYVGIRCIIYIIA